MAGALLDLLGIDGARRNTAAPPSHCSAPSDGLGRQQPRFLGCLLAVAEAWLDGGPVQVAVSGEARLRAVDHHRVAALTTGRGRRVGESDAPGVPLLAYRAARRHGALAYVCRGMVCDAPVGTVDELRAALTA